MPDETGREREVKSEAGSGVGSPGRDEERAGKDREHLEKVHQRYQLVVNKAEKDWPEMEILGRQILELAGSPADWVVNQLVPGAGEDPEIAPDQAVDLAPDAEPEGMKRFQTRKPGTSPGARG